MILTAREVMTANPHCCLPEDPIVDAVSVMRDQNCGIVPVINREGQCVGVVTDRDLCLKVILERQDAETTPLRDVMTHMPLTCHLDDPIEHIVGKMEQRKVRRILVVDERNQCVGIISEADIALRQFNKDTLSELVSAVSS